MDCPFLMQNKQTDWVLLTYLDKGEFVLGVSDLI